MFENISVVEIDDIKSLFDIILLKNLSAEQNTVAISDPFTDL